MNALSAGERHVSSTDRQWENAGQGVQRQILGFDDQVMMVRVKFEKHAVGYVHTHPHRQVTYIESGTFDVQVGDVKKVLHAGDSFFAPPDAPHGVTAIEAGYLIDVFTPARQDFLSTTH
jgi:quercetin dioxygenase-like cupin family protein